MGTITGKAQRNPSWGKGRGEAKTLRKGKKRYILARVHGDGE